MPNRPAGWDEPDRLNRENANREPVPAGPPSSGASDTPGWTPGPWTVVNPDSFSNKYPVALVATGQCWEHGSLLIASGFRPAEPEASANMHLIAAAPDLYAALQLYVDHFGDPLKVARPALAKARGEKPDAE